MATRKTTTGTAVTNYDEEFARAAAEYSKQAEGMAGGQPYFSVRGGVLTFAGTPMPENRVACIVADFIYENAFYEGDFDPDNPQPPTCFAFGRVQAELAPHENVVAAGNAQNPQCGMARQPNCCELNEFGSADKGKGKACKNTAKLALIPVPGKFSGKTFDLEADNAEYVESAALGYFRLPVTSVGGFGLYVKQVSEALGVPPFGLVTCISVVPDPKTQFKVVFEPLQKIPKSFQGPVMKRNAEARAAINTPYPAPGEGEEEPAPKRPARGAKAAPKPAPRGRGR